MGTRSTALKMPASPSTFQNGLLFRRAVTEGFERGMTKRPSRRVRFGSRMRTDEIMGL